MTPRLTQHSESANPTSPRDVRQHDRAKTRAFAIMRRLCDLNDLTVTDARLSRAAGELSMAIETKGENHHA